VNDVIKEYLVSLGFDVDLASYAKFNKVLDSSDSSVLSFASTAASSFIKAGAAFAAFVVTVVTGMAKMIDETADADLEFKKFARQMLTTSENAKSVKMSLDAMGVSLDDLWMSPELLNQFRQLRNLSKDLEPPDDFDEQMQFVRSIKFELTKAKMELSYSLQWISYYLIKYLRKPLESFRNTLQKINEAIREHMPEWTKKVAQFASWFFRLFNMFVKGGAAIIDMINKIPGNVKKVLLALAALAPLLAGNPFFLMIAMIATLLLLLEDFSTYMEGGESALGDFWSKLVEVGADGKTAFVGIFGELGEELGELGVALGDTLMAFLSLFGIDNVEGLKSTIGDLATFMGDTLIFALQTIVDLLNIIHESLVWLDELNDKIMDMDLNLPEGSILNEMMNDDKSLQEKIWGDLQSYAPSKNRYSAKASETSGNKVEVNSNPIFHIYGSDPSAVSSKVNNTQERLLTRALSGRLT